MENEHIIIQALEQLQKSQESFNVLAKDALERIKAADLKYTSALRTIQGWITHAHYNINTSSQEERITICNNLIETIDAYCKEQLENGKRKR